MIRVFRKIREELLREYADSVKARPDIELPRLREFAEEIQKMINEEYR